MLKEDKMSKYVRTKAEASIEILKRYAVETGVIVRSTSDLSPLEEWLISEIIVLSSQSQSKTFR